MNEQLELIATTETPEPEPAFQVIWIECDSFAYDRMRDAAAGDVWGERRD